MKKIILIVSCIAVITLILVFLHFQTYSINEIEADNYRAKLKSSDHSIWECMVVNYIPDNIGLWDYGTDYQVVQPINVKVDITQQSPTRKLVEIVNTPSTLFYQMVLENKVPIVCQIIAWHYGNDPQLVKIAEHLIMERQFVLKKSYLINGEDILIKEIDDDFIIVRIGGKYDYNNPPMSISISTYSKKRFF